MAAAVVGATLRAPYFSGVALAEQPQRGLDPPRLARDLARADRVGAPGGGYVSVRRAPVRPEPRNGVRSRDADVDLQAFAETGLGVGGERTDPTSGEGENEPGEVEPLPVRPNASRTRPGQRLAMNSSNCVRSLAFTASPAPLRAGAISPTSHKSTR